MGLGISPLGLSPLGIGDPTTPPPPPPPPPPAPGEPDPISATSLACQSNPETGVVTISAITPNGHATVTRSARDTDDFVLRQGSLMVGLGGFVLTDSEAPLGVPVDYAATVDNIPLSNRLIQDNLMLTPTFAYGVQSWAPGANRTLTTAVDSTSRTGTVGVAGANATGTTPGAPPTIIGHVNSTYNAVGSYTLTPPTTGGTAIATNDWMVLTHTQLVSLARPATPTGWTEVADSVYGDRRQILWLRKRAGGDTGYTVTALGIGGIISTLLWVRGASDEVLRAGPDQMPQPGLSTVTATGRRTVLRPSLVVSVFSALATSTTTTAPTTTSVTGGTWQYNHASGTNPAVVTIATTTMTSNGDTPTVTTTFSDVQSAGLGTQLIFQIAGSVTNQVIAKAKAAALPPDMEPYLFTGRIKFNTPALWTWQDVLDQGTWQHLKDTKATWNDVRGSGAVFPDGNFVNLFVTIVDPATGMDYVNPQLVLSVGESSVNKWLDFSVLIHVGPTAIAVNCQQEDGSGETQTYPCYWDSETQGNGIGDSYWIDGPDVGPRYTPLPGETVPCSTEDGSSPTQDFPCYWDASRQGNGLGDSFWLDGPGGTPRYDLGIPATAEIRISHGTSVKEYPVVWSLDQFGITPGWQRAVHGTRYWFDGDSMTPTNAEDYMLPDGIWDSAATDAVMMWTSTPGNSPSVFYGPSAVKTSITCGLDPPATVPCEPVLLSDPTNTQRQFWGSLISIADTTHPANLSTYSALNREDKVVVPAIRNWQESELVLQTTTLADRETALKALQKGKILLLRNPNTAYPERNWYLAIGDVTESRVSPNHRDPARFWTIPFIRVNRPTGDIEAPDRPTWADVKAMGTWADVLAVRRTWLGVATGRSS